MHDIRVKRSESRSCLHDKAFELGTLRELRELLCSGAIRGYQVRGKRPFDPNINARKIENTRQG